MNFNEIENLSEQEIVDLYEDIIEVNNSELISIYCTWRCQCKDGSNRYAYGYNSGNYTGRYDTDANNLDQSGMQGCLRTRIEYYLAGGCYGGANSAYTTGCR